MPAAQPAVTATVPIRITSLRRVLGLARPEMGSLVVGTLLLIVGSAGAAASHSTRSPSGSSSCS